MNRLELKLRLVWLYRRMIDGDERVKDEAMKIRQMLKDKIEEPQQLSGILNEAKFIASKGEIKEGKVVSNVVEVEHQGERKVVELGGNKISFTELLGEDVVKKKEEKKEEFIVQTEVPNVPVDVQKVESIDEIVEETPVEIKLNEDNLDRLEDILGDKEKEKLIMKILNNKPKKVPESPERIPEKISLPEQEAKKIPEKHKSRFDTLINLISQIFKVIKK